MESPQGIFSHPTQQDHKDLDTIFMFVSSNFTWTLGGFYWQKHVATEISLVSLSTMSPSPPRGYASCKIALIASKGLKLFFVHKLVELMMMIPLYHMFKSRQRQNGHYFSDDIFKYVFNPGLSGRRGIVIVCVCLCVHPSICLSVCP